MNNLRVMMVGSYVEPPWRDGVVSTIRNWCEGLANLGVDVDVYSLARATNKNSMLFNKVKYFFSPSRSERFGGTPLLNSIRLQKSLVKSADFLDYDIFHFHGLDSLTFLPTFVFLGLERKRRILSLFNTHLTKSTASVKDFLFDGFTPISHVIRSRLLRQGIGKHKVAVIPPSVDTELFSPRNKSRVRDFFSIPSDAFVILHAGHFREGRGIIELISVFNDLVKKRPKRTIMLLLAWTGYGQDNTIRTIFRLVRQTEDIVLVEPSDNISLLYNAADVYVLPAYDDRYVISIPLTILEAMSSGCPVISASISGIRDVIEEGVGGCLFNSKNFHQLRKMLLDMIDNKICHKDLVWSARNLVVERFSKEAVATKLVDFYKRDSL